MDVLMELSKLQDKHSISPSGEGGEIETTVLDAPFFSKRIRIKESSIEYESNSGIFKIEKADLVKK